MDLKLEIVVLPVSDVDRAKEFYAKLGCRQDADFTAEDGLRVVQMTPPGSLTSIIFGSGIIDAPPGSTKGVHFVVDDVMKAHDELAAKGIEVGEVEQALRDAAAAHGKHEEETGKSDENWPEWYAQYMAKAAGVE